MSQKPPEVAARDLRHIEVRTNTAICWRCKTVACWPPSKLVGVYEQEVKSFAAEHAECKVRKFRERNR